MALSFDPNYSYDLPNPLDPSHSKEFVNAHGQRQGTCVHLGNCDVGCDARAKNTLDLNYIAAAERHGAEVRPLHIVRSLRPDGTGYRVRFDRIDKGRVVAGEESAERLVLAAGSLGSTELLLRCRDEFRTLPKLSRHLGQGWSPNANVLTTAVYPDAATVHQSIGPTISAGIDFMDGGTGQRFVIEDDGFPNLLLNALNARLQSAWLHPIAWGLNRALRRGLDENNLFGNVMVWLGAGVDAADGRLSLGRNLLTPWKRSLRLTWNVRKSKAVIRAILDMHRRLSDAGGGHLHIPLFWRLFRTLVTVHPLGGCRMGTHMEDGVVDHKGEVFGYPNLHVSDGSVLPVPVGRNPSLTIAALAERGSAMMVRS